MGRGGIEPPPTDYESATGRLGVLRQGLVPWASRLSREFASRFAAFRAWMEPDALVDSRIEPLEFHTTGNKVLVHQLNRARGAGSGYRGARRRGPAGGAGRAAVSVAVRRQDGTARAGASARDVTSRRVAQIRPRASRRSCPRPALDRARRTLEAHLITRMMQRGSVSGSDRWGRGLV